MTRDRLMMGLLTVTVALQIGIFWRQLRGPGSFTPPQAVKDAPPNTRVALAGHPIKGEGTAKLVLLEYSDYECPYCARHATSVGPEIDNKYVFTGKLRHVFVNNPLPMHPNAKLLAVAANCAGVQNHYWQMHDALFQTKPKSKEEVRSLAITLKIDIDGFEKCFDLENETEKGEIEKDLESAKSLGMTGTPAFAIGWAENDGAVLVKKIVTGAQPMTVFDSVVTEMLSSGPNS